MAIDSFLELLNLNLRLFKIKAKTLIIRLKFIRLFFERRILIFRKRNALLEYDRRAMLIDELFDTVKQSHDTSLVHNVQAQARAEAGDSPL